MSVSPGNVDEFSDAEGPVIEVKDEGENELGMRAPKKVKDPKAPTQEEIDEHMSTHIPFRDW